MESHVDESRTAPIKFVTINWTNQNLHIMSQLRNLLASGGFYKEDITINCDGGSIDCHKILLCLCSGFFADVFKDKNVDSKSLILLPCVSAKTFGYLYKYMMNGKVTLPMDQVSLFYQAGSDLKVHGTIDETTTVTIGENTGDSCSEARIGGVSNNENYTPVEVLSTTDNTSNMNVFPSTSTSNDSIARESIIDKSKDLSGVCVYNPYSLEELEKGNVRNEEKQCVTKRLFGRDAWVDQHALKESSGNIRSLANTKTSPFRRSDSDPDNEKSVESDFKNTCNMVSENATSSQELPDRVYVIRNRLKIRSFSQLKKNGKKSNRNCNLSQASKRITRKKRTSYLFFKGNKYTLEQAKKLTVKCPNCSMQLKLFSLKLHQLTACKANNFVENSGKHDCMFEDCQFSSSDIKVTRAHAATHKDKYYCNVCQHVFTNEENRNTHKLHCEGSLASVSINDQVGNDEEMESDVIPISQNE